MKTLKVLEAIFQRFFRFRPDLAGTDSEGDKGPTLKRTRLNRNTKFAPKTDFGKEEACPTKQFRSCQPTYYHRWVFTVIEGNDRGRQFVGATPELKIGRQPENHICLRDPKVSRFHALIKVKDSYLIIKDLQSTNGTVFNNERIRRQKLKSGDSVKFGDTVIRVTLEKN